MPIKEAQDAPCASLACPRKGNAGCGGWHKDNTAFPLGRQRGGGFAAKRKPTPPRCARQPLPREGARVVIPSFHRKGVPRRGGGWMGGSAVPETKPSPRGEGGERSEPDRVLAVGKRAGKIVSSRQFTRAPERRCAVPLPQWGRQRNENAAIPETQPSPRETGRGIHFSFTNFHLSMI